MHLREAAAHGLNYAYELIDLETLSAGPEILPQLFDDAERRGFTGLNITHPCKQIAIPLLDELSEEAAMIGAVNTVLFKNGKRIGHNTDWKGFAEAFRRGLRDVRLDCVVQLGAGGAGAATAYAALVLGAARLIVFDLQPTRAATLARNLAKGFGETRIWTGSDLATTLRDAEGLIHATPTGMVNYPGLPLPSELLSAKLWIYEVVYFPLETELLRTARRMGCRTLNGAGMAIFQAVEAFRLFTGITPDAERMANHLASLTSS
jgi:shikimate dehydrogenase